MNNWINTVELISKTTEAVDADGFPIEEAESKRMLFCNEKSIRSTEYYAMHQLGIIARVMLEVNADEYNGETTCIYQGHQYNIYRTYRKVDGNTIELTLAEDC